MLPKKGMLVSCKGGTNEGKYEDKLTCMEEDILLVSAQCNTTIGSSGILECVNTKHLRYGPTRLFKSCQCLTGWTASYSEILHYISCRLHCKEVPTFRYNITQGINLPIVGTHGIFSI